MDFLSKSRSHGLLLLIFLVFCTVFRPAYSQSDALSRQLVGHWPLEKNTSDVSKSKLKTRLHGRSAFEGDSPGVSSGNAGFFDGKTTWLEVGAAKQTQLGAGDFSLSAWVNTDHASADFPGDIISQYDLKTRKGFHLSLKSNVSPTSQSSYRQLTFGIDDGKSGDWVDEGQPGTALMAFALAEHKGELYAGVCQPGPGESGRVFKHAGKDNWVDYGAPDQSNSVTALAVWDGELYAATGHYRVSGSSLPNSENQVPGGKVFRFAAPDRWEEIGQLPDVVCVGGLMVYKGKLYASSMYAPSGFFRYDGDNQWVKLPNPEGVRVVNMGVHDGYLYATSWDHGHVYRYDGNAWEDCGLVGDNTQNYAFNIYEGNLYSATWPSGRVFRFDGVDKWADMGRLGTELEVMGMITYNGQMLGGTLPLAEVYVYEGDTLWTRMDQLDRTPDVKYRRAWVMSEHDGKVFCSTLPSGKIYSYESGKSVSMAESLGGGWQHVTAIKTRQRLQLFVNGLLVAEKGIPVGMEFDLTADAPIRIGFGANDYWSGRMRDVRIYKRALGAGEIRALAEQ